MPDISTRDLIISKADELFYQQGFEFTSFAHIAEAVGISRGNFYHHFKSKDEILSAVIERRMESARKLLEGWQQQASTPEARIRLFIQILIMNQTKIQRYGCPVGSLCSELAKLEHGLHANALELFGLFRTWLVTQFVALGLVKKADEFAMHVLAASQGIAVIASNFQDVDFVQREVKGLETWLKQVVSGVR